MLFRNSQLIFHECYHNMLRIATALLWFCHLWSWFSDGFIHESVLALHPPPWNNSRASRIQLDLELKYDSESLAESEIYTICLHLFMTKTPLSRTIIHQHLKQLFVSWRNCRQYYQCSFKCTCLFLNLVRLQRNSVHLTTHLSKIKSWWLSLGFDLMLNHVLLRLSWIDKDAW